MIEWTHTRYSERGKVPLAPSAWWGIGWQGTASGTRPGYLLSCEVPGIKSRIPVDSLDAGKEHAERQLALLRSWIAE